MKDTFILSGICIFMTLMMLLPILVIVFLQLRKKGLVKIDLRRGPTLKRLLLILAVIVVGLGIFAVAGEYIEDSSAYQDGVQACEEGNYLTAVDHFDRIIYSSRFADIGGFVKKAAEEKVSCFDRMAASSKQDGDYGMALVAYAGLITSSDDETIFESSGSEIAIIFTENDPASLANLELCDRIDILVEASLIPQPDTNLPPLYLACGQLYLAEGSDYDSAIATYQIVIDQYADSEEASIVVEELAATYYAASVDSGEYGASLIRESWEQVCKGEPATSPAVGLAENEPGKVWFGGSEFKLPSELVATSPGQFHYAVCVERGVEIIETCLYSGGKSISRGRHRLSVQVRDVRNGEIVEEKSFLGSSPRGCPQTISQAYNLRGNYPSDSLAFNWVMENLNRIIQ
jgi:hypothetical protein